MTPSVRPTRRPRTPLVTALATGLGITLLIGLVVGLGITLDASPARSQEPAAAAPQPPPLPEVSDEYRAAMRRFLQSQIHFDKIGETVAFQVANETLYGLAQMGIPITEQTQQIVLDEAKSTYATKFSDLEYLTTIWAPVYKQYFERDEIEQMTKWFKTDLGKKLMTVSPEINQRGMFEIQQASIAMSPEFQLAVDARLREAGLVPEAPEAQP